MLAPTRQPGNQATMASLQREPGFRPAVPIGETPGIGQPGHQSRCTRRCRRCPIQAKVTLADGLLFPSRLRMAGGNPPLLPRAGRVQFRAAPADQGCQFRWRGTFLFTRSSLLSLAEPPTGTPLRGRGAFGSSLKGIPPPVPSRRPAPPPRDERAIPLSVKQKGTICHPSPLPLHRKTRTLPSAPRHR